MHVVCLDFCILCFHENEKMIIKMFELEDEIQLFYLIQYLQYSDQLALYDMKVLHDVDYSFCA